MLKLYHGTNTTFDKVELNKCLQDKGTGLYLRSAAYTYEYLKKEIIVPKG